MQTLSTFFVKFLEFPVNYSAGDSYTVHTASCSLSGAIVDDVVSLFSTQAGTDAIEASKRGQNITLDLVCSECPDTTIAVGFVIADPEFLSSWAQTVENRVITLCDDMKSLMTSAQFSVGQTLYSSESTT